MPHILVGSDGAARAYGRVLHCTLGKNGVTADKREGDHKTPCGLWFPVSVFYRAGKVRRPRSFLPVQAVRQNDGWCDASGDVYYNHPVRHPFRASAEKMWRADSLYDLGIVLDYNYPDAEKGKGSAIFVHHKRPNGAGTEGCLGFAPQDLWWLVHRLREGDGFLIE